MATRSVVKHSYIKQSRGAAGRLKAHIRYIAYRPGKTKHPVRSFFSEKDDAITPKNVLQEVGSIRTAGVLIHKLILSPGVSGVDTREYTRYVLKELAERKGYCLNYRAVVHDNTEHEHAHVVIFGRDRNNRSIRFSKDDYAFMRERGDRFVEKTIERELEVPPPEILPFNPAERFFKLLTGTVGKFADVFKDLGIIGKNLPPSLTPQSDDEPCIGRLWTDKQKLTAWSRQRQMAIKAEEFANQPIEITVATNVRKHFTQNNSKEDLIALKTTFDGGFYSDQLTKRDVAKLDSWISQWEHWESRCSQVEKRLYAKSFDVDCIEIQINSRDSKWFTKNSYLDDLQALNAAHQAGRISLQQEEAKALERWIAQKKLTEPIVIDLGDNSFPLIYGHKDPVDSLRLLARTAKDALEPDEYKRLWRWIFIKEEEIRREVELSKPIVLETEFAKLEFTRHDSREHLRALLDRATISKLTELEVARVKAWLKEKDERDKGLERELGF